MVNIQWYPGHMEKARRDMQEYIKAVDLIIEVRDARIPLASANPILSTMAQGKPRLVILGKSDLADEAETKRWISYLKETVDEVVDLDMIHDKNTKSIVIQLAKELTAKKREKMISRGIRPRAMRAMVCGIPNSGKSTLINRISGKTSAKTADKPGVTRSLTWIHADSTLDVLDTPGVLWPKFEDPQVGIYLGATGAINENILDQKEIAVETIGFLLSYYESFLEKEYALKQGTPKEEWLETIAKARHLKKENNIYDLERSAIVFLHELRRGKLGRMTLERVNDEKSLCE